MSNALLAIGFRPAFIMRSDVNGIWMESLFIENGDRVESAEIVLPWCDVAEVAYALLAAVEANEQKDSL